MQLGYFATDLLLLVVHYPSFGGPEMAVHHVAALVSVAAAAFQVRAARNGRTDLLNTQLVAWP